MGRGSRSALAEVPPRRPAGTAGKSSGPLSPAKESGTGGRPIPRGGRLSVALPVYFWPVISASRASTVSSCFFTLPTMSAPTIFPSLSTIYVVG